MDTKFSVAVHVLILVAESSIPVNSEQMAESVGTNASYIRKILSLLKKSGIVDGHRGISGYSLAVRPDNLTLLQIYRAVTDEEKIHLIDIHKNVNDGAIKNESCNIKRVSKKRRRAYRVRSSRSRNSG